MQSATKKWGKGERKAFCSGKTARSDAKKPDGVCRFAGFLQWGKAAGWQVGLKCVFSWLAVPVRESLPALWMRFVPPAGLRRGNRDAFGQEGLQAVWLILFPVLPFF